MVNYYYYYGCILKCVHFKTNIKIKFYNINHSWVPSDDFLSTCRMNFSLNLRGMVEKHPFYVVQTKSSDRKYKLYLQLVPQENRTQREMSPCEHQVGKIGNLGF